MSCQIKGIALINDVSEVKKLLFENSILKFDHVPKNELPLQDAVISLSSAGDVLGLALHKNIIILTSKWDLQEPSENKNKFHISWTGSLVPEAPEYITSILCLPLISLGKSNSGPDWTCTLVGFSSGYLRCYTETGCLLLEEQLHNEPILNLKCQSLTSPRHTGDTGLSEELHIIYESVVCILPGFPFFSTLRACRNYLARVQANYSSDKPPSCLTFKKLGFKDQDVTNDCEVIGTTSVNTFDHLMTASICGGFHASYRSSAPQHNLVMATGKRPYVGFHFALEGGAAPVLSDVALAMASSLANAIGKIGTAVPWFRGSKPSLEKPKGPVQEAAEAMTCRFGLSDVMREGDSLIVSPNKSLSVITDAMGRVTLINNRRGLALRMWKGYRDAQCGWIEVAEDKRSKVTSKRRTALFLVIYAPKKGVIDIWGIQTGGKITTFSASKNGRLLYINYGLLGLNDVAPTSPNRPAYSCVFLDPLGGLKEILVPFHFALSNTNGKRARDIHLFKKLKTFIREQDYDEDKLVSEVSNICKDLKTNEIRQQVLETLMASKHVISDVLLSVTTIFNDALVDQEMEATTKPLVQLCAQIKHVVTFYKYLKSRKPSAEQVAPNESEWDLAAILLSSPREITRILKLVQSLEDTESRARVTFKGGFVDFISSFDFGCNQVTLAKDVTEDKKELISELIYQGWMDSNESIEAWKAAAEDSGIQGKTFMELALVYWLHKRPVEVKTLKTQLKRFTDLLHAICNRDAEEICVGYNQVSPWWKDTRQILTESVNPLQALTAALACRSVAITLSATRDQSQASEKEALDVKNGNVKDQKPDDPHDWENVSKDVCQFTLLIGNLEDIAILNRTLQRPRIDDSTNFLALPFEKLEVSLGNVIAEGQGSVSEIVAKWLSTSGVDPSRLIDTSDVEFDSGFQVDAADTQEAKEQPLTKEEAVSLINQSVEIGNEARADSSSLAQILDKIALLKHHFPYSLTSSVLLANLTWQYVMAWSRDVSRLEILEAALSVLKQIPMKSMRQGVCCLLWTVHIKKRMEAAAKLMNKLGKLPKERLCAQEVGLSDIQTTVFLQHCVSFLDIFLDAEVMEEDKNAVFKAEEMWEGHAGPQAFAALAITQVPGSYDLILLHLQLGFVLHMIAFFGIKSVKPMTNLFESVTSRYFFQDITDKFIFTWYHDDKRDSRRLDFLYRIITASMESIHQETTEDGVDSKQAVQWMSKCTVLASMWKIDCDKLRIHQICQLYVNGFDRLAEEVMTSINDTETLAVNLIPIAGLRMMAFLSKSPDLLEEVSRISPALTQYLENLNLPGIIITSCSNENNIELIKKISQYLPETHNDYHYAQLMLDATFIYQSG
ncbi:rab3 GTPase-activating protein non-catalytic subunit [Microplitis demolitor]|uniref:rab3 GTPase-activating protein non-catalytic subunit n=1 Tax=Microplitis demolitor TaxID=69319 RepID=UPI00043FFF41|nr:rab3 GTPase-activating protein non-catalytic subunit [Microplitis demolitor]